MASRGMFFVVSRTTLVASLCTLSSFSRLDSEMVSRPRPQPDDAV